MQRINLTRGMAAIVDDEDFLALSAHKWCVLGNGYAARRESGKMVYMHRIIAKAKSGEYVDHVNLDKLDNRRSNLRICTKQQNQHNQGPRCGTSIYKGVSYRKDTGKFSAQIWYARKKMNLGCFESEEDAAIAYNKAALVYHGAFARLNKVSKRGETA